MYDGESTVFENEGEIWLRRDSKDTRGIRVSVRSHIATPDYHWTIAHSNCSAYLDHFLNFANNSDRAASRRCRKTPPIQQVEVAPNVRSREASSHDDV
jgi:hypothetical protein